MITPNITAARLAPRRVLHIVESIDRGAVENWLLRLYRFARENDVAVDWTFYCMLPKEGRRETELRKLGAQVVRSPVTLRSPLAFARSLREFAAKGRFDVVHAHHDIQSGLYLLALSGLQFERRIVHAHNADLSLPTSRRWKAHLFGKVFSAAVRIQADVVVGISQYVVDHFVRRMGVARDRSEILLYGVDTEPFRHETGARERVRGELNLGDDQRVLLFIGRLTWFKNPVFVVDVLAELKRRGENVVALFAGTGPEESNIRRRADELGVQQSIRILGWRNDNAALMIAADAFVFPRAEQETEGVGREGLGLTVVESQAAGLPTIVSRAIPMEAFVARKLCRVVPLDAGVSSWADAVSAELLKPRIPLAQSTALVDASPLSMARSLEAMINLHQG